MEDITHVVKFGVYILASWDLLSQTDAAYLGRVAVQRNHRYDAPHLDRAWHHLSVERDPTRLHGPGPLDTFFRMRHIDGLCLHQYPQTRELLDFHPLVSFMAGYTESQVGFPLFRDGMCSLKYKKASGRCSYHMKAGSCVFQAA